MKELVFKKCYMCGALVEVLEDCNCDDCGINCCGEQMKLVKANSVDAAIEKHVPTYEIVDDMMVISVNHVMESDHYIEWILVQTQDSIYKKQFLPGDIPSITVPYEKGAVLYSYCNKHGLWKSEVK